MGRVRTGADRVLEGMRDGRAGHAECKTRAQASVGDGSARIWLIARRGGEVWSDVMRGSERERVRQDVLADEHRIAAGRQLPAGGGERLDSMCKRIDAGVRGNRRRTAVGEGRVD